VSHLLLGYFSLPDCDDELKAFEFFLLEGNESIRADGTGSFVGLVVAIVDKQGEMVEWSHQIEGNLHLLLQFVLEKNLLFILLDSVAEGNPII
jgi:hypothetical protein